MAHSYNQRLQQEYTGSTMILSWFSTQSTYNLATSTVLRPVCELLLWKDVHYFPKLEWDDWI